jgi:hypothetical protein
MNRRGWGEEGEVTSGLVPHPSFLRDSYFSTGRHDQTQTLSNTSDTLGIHRNATSITKHTLCTLPLHPDHPRISLSPTLT